MLTPNDTPISKPTIVLVHGAFANASCWNNVIVLLLEAGYPVMAVQHPMSSYADDVAATQRVLEKIQGPVVLVGHSYGGAVITGAATAGVKALVYIAAFGPDQGETLTTLQQSFPVTSLGTALAVDSVGYATIVPDQFQAVFCADLPDHETQVMAITQGPAHASLFETPFPVPAWKTIPSWFLVSRQDQAINPDLERFCASRMKATTVEIDASHVSFLSHPQAVVDIIVAAATAISR